MHLGAVPSTGCGVAAAVDDDEFGHTRAGPVDKHPSFCHGASRPQAVVLGSLSPAVFLSIRL